MDTISLQVSTGRQIALYRWQPDGEVRSVVLISHGLSEHGQRYGRLAQMLCRQGVLVLAYDHRGHGPAAEVPGWFAVSDGWQQVLDDLHSVRQYLTATWPGLPLVLYGHSMGSFIARAYFLHHGAGLAGLILSATGYRQGAMAGIMRFVAQQWGRVVGQQTPSRFLSCLVFGSFNLTFRPRRTACDWLSRDPVEVDRYLADPYCAGLPTPGLWADLFGGVAALEQAERKARALPGCPVLLLAGSRDPVSWGWFGLGQLARRYLAAGLQQIDLLVYPGGRHEMHNETNREQVEHDMLAWLQTNVIKPDVSA